MKLGNKTADNEHLMMFVLLAQLASTHQRDSALECLKNFHSQFIIHCASEESFMKAIKNPLLREHTMDHISYKNKIAEAVSRVENFKTDHYSGIANILDIALSIHITDWDREVFVKSVLYDPELDAESGFGL